MLGNNDVTEAIAFKDIEPGKNLYEGQQVRTEESGGRAYKRGISHVQIGESKCARSNRATSATWAIGDEIDTVLQALKGF